MVWQPAFRPYQALVVEGAITGPLCGSTLLLPLVLSLGMSPGVAWLLFLLPSIGVGLQAILPTLLAASRGRLRLLTIAAYLASETRGIWFVLVLSGHASGVLGGDAELFWVAIVVLATGVLGNITSNNLSVWYGLALPDRDRRRLLPRVGTMSAAISAVVLWLLTCVLGSGHLGDGVYVAAFAVGGITSIVGLWGLMALPDPGRVRPRPVHRSPRAALTGSGRFANFCRASTLAAAGGGLMPAVALIALGPLRLPASFTVFLAAVSSTLSLFGSGLAASLIATLSASRVVRATQFARLVETALLLLAILAPAVAPLLLVAVTMSSAITSAVNGVAGSELLYRMSGPSIVVQQGRYSALTHGAFTVTSLVASAVITAAGTVPVFVLLLGVSGAARLTAGALLRVSPTWHDLTETEADTADVGDAAVARVDLAAA